MLSPAVLRAARGSAERSRGKAVAAVCLQGSGFALTRAKVNPPRQSQSSCFPVVQTAAGGARAGALSAQTPHEQTPGEELPRRRSWHRAEPCPAWHRRPGDRLLPREVVSVVSGQRPFLPAATTNLGPRVPARGEEPMGAPTRLRREQEPWPGARGHWGDAGCRRPAPGRWAGAEGPTKGRGRGGCWCSPAELGWVLGSGWRCTVPYRRLWRLQGSGMCRWPQRSHRAAPLRRGCGTASARMRFHVGSSQGATAAGSELLLLATARQPSPPPGVPGSRGSRRQPRRLPAGARGTCLFMSNSSQLTGNERGAGAENKRTSSSGTRAE